MVVSTVIGICLLFGTGCLVAGDAGSCPSNMGYLPSEDDVQSAVLMCDETYKDVNEYDQVNGYVVQDVITVLDHANVKHKVVIADQGSTRIVAFRGSNGFNQLMMQSASFRAPPSPLAFNDGTTVNVVDYYGKSFSVLFRNTVLLGYLQDSNIQRFIFTGHSLGGALASLVAMGTALEIPSVWDKPGTSLIVFGQPRVGDSNFVIKHDEIISPSRKLRFVYKADAVNYMPAKSLGYTHFSGEIFVTATYWKVCKERENPSCSMAYQNMPRISHHTIAKYKTIVPYQQVRDGNGNIRSSIQNALWNTYC